MRGKFLVKKCFGTLGDHIVQNGCKVHLHDYLIGVCFVWKYICYSYHYWQVNVQFELLLCCLHKVKFLVVSLFQDKERNFS